MAAGAALGAGVALLAAPRSGEHTRLALARELRRVRPSRSRSAWELISDEFDRAVKWQHDLRQDLRRGRNGGSAIKRGRGDRVRRRLRRGA